MVTASFRLLPRPALVARILRAAGPLTVIEAPAGTGKSVLLAALAQAGGLSLSTDAAPPAAGLWDVPAVAQTAPLPTGARLVIAKRPGTAIPGLARARVYGEVSEFTADDLLLTEAELVAAGLAPGVAAEVMVRSGGWPCLLPAVVGARAEPEALAEFLHDEILSHYPPAAIAALGAHLAEPLRRFEPRLLAGLPFAHPGTALHPALAAVRAPLQHAIARRLAERTRDPADARAVAVMQAALGRLPEAIATFQGTGAWQAALAALRQSGGPFFLQRFGPEATERMLAGFPAGLLLEDETLVTTRAMLGVKGGDVALALHVLTERWGPRMLDAAAVLGDRDFSLPVRFFRLVLRIWEDFSLPVDFLDAAYRLHAEMSPGDDLGHGAFYNTVLEFYIRERRLPEAEHVALEAARHFGRIPVPVLSFFIELHLGLIRLMQGDTGAAQRQLVQAQRFLEAVSYACPAESRILAMVEACVAFERGNPDALHHFLAGEIDALTEGEIWPGIAEVALTYGSQHLLETRSLVAARAFLDRWRVRQERAAQFRSLIDLREIALMQSAGRWAEAGRMAAQLPSSVTLDFVLAGADRLATLRDRDDVAMALVWLRQLAQTAPRRPGLERLVASIIDNPHLLGRQRVAARVWQVHILRRTGHQGPAAAMLARLFGDAARDGVVAPLTEERQFLVDILATHRMREAVEAEDGARRILRGLLAPGPARAAGLTRQETRILRALAEGASNKAIANLMGLSESTVKFHLANLYRKLGVTTRRGALSRAHASGLLR
ncbi:MAG: LuxR family transcriptional regulator [Rubellimicrobium sp.]|nr:LuxR family transcriptional regulator [Rubellimicrobium sp.]